MQLPEYIRDFFSCNIVTLGGGLFALFIVFSIYKAVRNRKEKQKRLTELQKFAAENGWTFTPKYSTETFENWKHYAIIDHSFDEINGILQTDYDGGKLFLFDYTYRVRKGKTYAYYTQTIASFHTPNLNVPYFMLARETIGSRLGEIFGYPEIDFSTHPVFSEKFHLAGAEEAAIRKVFEQNILNYLETLTGIQIDAGGNQMFIYFHNDQIPLEHLNNFLGTAVNIYKLFRNNG